MTTPCTEHLLIVHIAGAVGGAERTTNNLLLGLDRDFARTVSLLSMPMHRGYWVPRYGEFVDASELGIGGWYTGPSALWSEVGRLVRLMRRLQPTLVVGVMHYGAAAAVLAARLVTPRPRVVMSLRGPLFEYLCRYESNSLRRLALRSLMAVSSRLADRIWVPSAGTGQELVRRFLAPKEKIGVIPNGIDALAVKRTLAGQLDEGPVAGGERPLICTVARLAGEKRLTQLLEGFALIRRTLPGRLLVVGDGPERQALEQRAEQLGVGAQVEFLGYREVVYPLLAAADVFVHTCEFEGFGYAILEAMACGTPVVATDCPYGPREIIGDNEYGLLVPPDDPSALAAAVAAVVSQPRLRERLSRRGLERARELSVERMQQECRRELAALCCGPE